MTLSPDVPAAHPVVCPNCGQFLSRHPLGTPPLAGASGFPFAATASPPSGLTVPGSQVSPGAVAASPWTRPGLRTALGLGGLGGLAVLVVGPKAVAAAAWVVSLGGLSLAALATLLGGWLWQTLPESDRGPMGVAGRADYENHGSE